MANPCAALDPTWTHLLPAAHVAAAGHCHYSASSSWPFPFPGAAAAAFENEALTSALRASMSPASANASAASSSSYPTTPSSSSSTSSASDLLSAGGVGHDAPAAAPAPPAAAASRPGGGPPLARAAATTGPKAGRVTKRKPRPSRRPPVTYITADPANFRRMVQEVTGFPVTTTSSSGSGLRRHDVDASEPAPRCWPAAPPAPACCALPTLDTSAFLLLDRASVLPAPAGGRQPDDDDKSSSGGSDDNASPAMAEAAVVTAPPAVAEAVEEGGGDDTSVLLELEAIACAPALVYDDFPTLDSWGIL